MSDDSFKDFVLDQLRDFDDREVRAKRMFGAYGLYLGDQFIAILDDGALYMKADRALLQSLGVSPVRPFSFVKRTPEGKKKKIVMKRYFWVPADILEDRKRLQIWARSAAGLEK